MMKHRKRMISADYNMTLHYQRHRNVTSSYAQTTHADNDIMHLFVAFYVAMPVTYLGPLYSQFTKHLGTSKQVQRSFEDTYPTDSARYEACSSEKNTWQANLWCAGCLVINPKYLTDRRKFLIRHVQNQHTQSNY